MSGLVNGLQNRLRRFESARHLVNNSEIPVDKGVSEFLFIYFSRNVTKTLPFLFLLTESVHPKEDMRVDTVESLILTSYDQNRCKGSDFRRESSENQEKDA